MNPSRGHRPSLAHPVKVQLVQVDPKKTPGVDPQFREPAGRVVYKAPVTLTAQLGLDKTELYRQRPGGDDPQSDGYLVVRREDLRREAPGVVLHKGDRIVRLYPGKPEEQRVEFVVDRVEPRGEYGQGDAMTSTLLFLFYRDMKTLAAVG